MANYNYCLQKCLLLSVIGSLLWVPGPLHAQQLLVHEWSEPTLWHCEVRNRWMCDLLLTFPGYGELILRRLPGQELAGLLVLSQPQVKCSAMTLEVVYPWDQQVMVSFETPFEPDCHGALRFSSACAEALLSNLTQGYFCQLKLTDYGQVKQVIYVRPYGMLAALEQFQQACQTQLWPGSEAEMCHSAVYFEEASHRLTPLACQWLDTLIAFAKAQDRVPHILLDGFAESSRDPAVYAVKLAELRAATVKDYLERGGLALGTIEIDHLSANLPGSVSSEHDRRVAVHIFFT